MARKCEASGKSTVYGGMRKHNRGKAGGTEGPWAFKATRRSRTWKPNLRKVKVKIGKSLTSIKISMKYYKKLRQDGKVWLKTRECFAHLR